MFIGLHNLVRHETSPESVSANSDVPRQHMMARRAKAKAEAHLTPAHRLICRNRGSAFSFMSAPSRIRCEWARWPPMQNGTSPQVTSA